MYSVPPSPPTRARESTVYGPAPAGCCAGTREDDAETTATATSGEATIPRMGGAPRRSGMMPSGPRVGRNGHSSCPSDDTRANRDVIVMTVSAKYLKGHSLADTS